MDPCRKRNRWNLRMRLGCLLGICKICRFCSSNRIRARRRRWCSFAKSRITQQAGPRTRFHLKIIIDRSKLCIRVLHRMSMELSHLSKVCPSSQARPHKRRLTFPAISRKSNSSRLCRLWSSSRRTVD